MYHSIDNEIDEQIIYKNTSHNTKLYKMWWLTTKLGGAFLC